MTTPNPFRNIWLLVLLIFLSWAAIYAGLRWYGIVQ